MVILLSHCNNYHYGFCHSVQQSGKIKSGTTPWPPFRPAGPVHPAYQDPRKVLKSRVFHALVWIVLYKAVNDHTVSEHVIALIVYLLEMALSVTDPVDQPTQVTNMSVTMLNLKIRNNLLT